MDLENIYMGRILIVNLNEGNCSEEDLTEEMVEEHIGGASLNLALYKQYADRDPLIFSTGPLTGTFAPSSCAGVFTGKSPLNGKVCHVPMLWLTALELKYSGYDGVVILGASDKPVRLWLHDELAELADASELWGKDTWQTTEMLRLEHGDDNVQLICIGPAGEKGSKIAQISENYWGSWDIFGMGAAMGAKKLKAIAMRGLGNMEVAEGYFGEAIAAQKEIIKGDIYQQQGMLPILERLGLNPDDLAPVQAKVHRNTASFNCAYAYNTYLMIDEPADLLHESKMDFPGLLLTDPAGVISLLFLKEGLPTVMRRINQLGLEPSACAALLKKEGISDAAEAEKKIDAFAAPDTDLESAGVESVYGVAPWPLSDTVEAQLIQALAVYSHAIPLQPIGGSWSDFAASGEAVEKAQLWLDRIGAAMILGICPLSSLLSPYFSIENMAQWAANAADWENLTAESLRNKSRQLLADTAALEAAAGKLPADWNDSELEEGLATLQRG